MTEHRAQSTEHRASLLPYEHRIEHVDIFRAFGILLMIMGHVGFGRKFDHFIHAFHMPMFFVVSGMFFGTSYERFRARHENPFTSFTARKAKTLLIPYICFGSLHYLLWLVRNWRSAAYLHPLLHLLSINTYGLPIAGALWFLTALFLTECAYCAVSCLTENPLLRSAIIILLALAGHVSCHYLAFPLPYAGNSALVGLGLYHIGCVFGKSLEKFSLSLPKTLIFGAFTGALIFLNGYVNMRTDSYSFVPLFYVNVIASCLVGLSLSRIAHSLFCGGRVCMLLQDIGKNSIVYLCLNQLAILVLARLFGNAGHLVIFVLAAAGLFIGSRIFAGLLGVLTGRAKNFRHSLLAAGTLVIVLVIAVSGVSFTKIRGFSGKIYIPDWSRISTDPLTPEQYRDSEALRRAAALNLRYLLNTQWPSPFRYAYSPYSSNVHSFTLTAAQEREVLNSAESFREWRNHDYLHLPNTTGRDTGENALRVWGHTCFVLASALKFNLYNEAVTGISREDAAEMAGKLTASLARDHCSNTFTGWGNAWQSALWAENIAFAAWLLWDGLSSQDRTYVVNMLIFEADRFTRYNVPYYRDKNGQIVFPDDTKAEENAWNSRILALAVCMLPDHRNNALWEAKLRELLLSSTARPEDLNSERLIDGVRVRDILRGSNIDSDGTVMNHGLHHIDYMTTTIEGMTDTAIIYALSGREIPEAALFNHDVIYSALVNLDLGKYDTGKAGRHFYGRTADGRAGTELDMPGRNDWGGKWFTSCYLADTEAEIFALDGNCSEGLKASDWAGTHLGVIDGMISRNDTGQIFAEGENYFVSGETYAMQNLCKAYLLRKLYAKPAR